MGSKPRIRLQIPDREGFDDEFSHFIPVSSEVVAYTIDLLQCFIAQYRRDPGSAPAAAWERHRSTKARRWRIVTPPGSILNRILTLMRYAGSW
jgi:hypothetical protein